MDKSKNGKLIRFSVLDTEGNPVRASDGKPVVVMAFTAKSAKHRARALCQIPVTVRAA